MFANPLHPESARTKTARLRRLALIGACLAFVAGGFSGVVAGPASAAYVFDAKWGSNGTGDGQFVFPTDLAIDGSGNVYVSDSSTITNRIQKFDSGGVFLTKWGSSGDAGGQFESPFGVAVDAAGDDVYVADSANNRIQRFDSSGTFERMWGRDVNQTNPGDLCTAASGDTCQTAGPILGDGHFQVPMGVATDAAGNNVYVADTSTNRIQKFDPAGTFDITWGFSGSGNGQFLLPNDVDTDADGSVYVADRDNNRIQKFSSAGNFVIKWGSSGSGDGQFAKPTGVATDADGNVYVADRDNNRIQKFNSAGLFLTEWGAPGVADGRFDGPEGLATDAAGNVYVVDTGNYRIQKFIEVAPETTIDSGPSPTTMDSTPSFTFSADQAGSSYECQTDDGGFGACTSPYATAPLIEGAHTFGVRAVNGGTPDPTPATRTFTVDTTAPDTKIDSGPAGTITFDEATFTFSGDPNVDIAGLECRIDGEPFADCTSPKTFTGLSEGPHTAEFRAEDTAGNQDPSPATRTFTVDTTAPVDHNRLRSLRHHHDRRSHLRFLLERARLELRVRDRRRRLQSLQLAEVLPGPERRPPQVRGTRNRRSRQYRPLADRPRVHRRYHRLRGDDRQSQGQRSGQSQEGQKGHLQGHGLQLRQRRGHRGQAPGQRQGSQGEEERPDHPRWNFEDGQGQGQVQEAGQGEGHLQGDLLQRRRQDRHQEDQGQ